MNIELRARNYSGSLSETDKEIVAFILNHKAAVAQMGIGELSNQVHVSNSSIVRLTKKLGLKGFSELKFLLEQELSQEKPPANQALSLIQLQTQDLEQTKGLIQQTDFSQIIQAIQQAENIYCYAQAFLRKMLLRSWLKC